MKSLVTTNVAEVEDVREKFVSALRILDAAGYSDLVIGHCTVAVPGTDLLWTNGFGVPWSVITLGDLVLIDRHDGTVRSGSLEPTGAIGLHLAILQARPDVGCVIHSHPPYATAYSALGQTLRMIEQTSVLFAEDHIVYDEYGGLVVQGQETAQIVDRLGGKNVALLRNHGVLVLGSSVKDATVRAVYLERTCHLNLIIGDRDDVLEVPPDAVRRAQEFLHATSFTAQTWAGMELIVAREGHRLPSLIGE